MRSRLPPKSLLGFALAILALAVISTLSFVSISERTESGRRMTATLETTQRLDGLLSTLKDAETGQRGYLLTGQDRYLEPYDAAVASLPNELSILRSALGGNPAQAQRLDALEHLVHDKLAELKLTIEDRREGRGDEAIRRVQGDYGRELMTQIRVVEGEMASAERAQAEARTLAWIDASSRAAAVTWIGAAVLLALIIAAAAASARDFHDQEVQAWLRTGQAELAAVVQGDKGLAELGEEVIAFLCRYVGAKVGAIYFGAEADRLARVGTFAVAPAADGGEVAKPFAGGLSAQAFSQKAVVEVDDVPDGFFAVSSGLGSSKPRHLLIAPGSVDGAVNSVVELGFFDRVSPEVRELVERLGESIASAFRSAKYRKEVRDLLEQTQHQAEELQTQQEELRVNNEELEQQSSSLQKSQELLRNQQAELEEINSQLESQTEALERERDGLVRARADLQRANAYKSEFLANMSHELRTPLNSSLIMAKLLADNPAGNLDEEQVKFARTIYAAGNDLLTLINDILDLSKIEAGKVDVRPETVPVRRLVDELASTFQPVARDRRLELAFDVAPDAPATVYTDPLRVQQILKNLLSNALKFTENGGVTLGVARGEEGRVTFAVKDTGIGIATHQQEVIFEAFRQADGTTNRKYGGTGLGLSISRDLARLLDGELSLVSAPGRGSTFTLAIPEQYTGPARADLPPKGPPPPAPRPTPPKANGVRAREPAPVPDDRGAHKPGVRTILVIDDDIAFASIVRDLARELDFEAIVATTAEGGLALAAEHRPSAIVLDVGLPDRSGLSVLDALKRDPTTRHIPVHIISATDHVQSALEMGAAGYALKPVRREEIADALRKLEVKFTQKVRRVLVVEDDAVQRDATCRLLAGQDVQTVAIGSAAEAMEQLRGSTFDCMVLDLSLPDRTGFELLEEMSHEERSAFPPVIVYTGRSLSAEEEQQLRRFSRSIIVKGARSPERLLDEVTLFLHQVEFDLPPDRQRMLRTARHREAVFEDKRVLIVEDDVRNVFALTSVLESRGARVEIARNGREALRHLEQNPGVDLVLMDIMMPEMDGLHATREIRRQQAFARLPIIALTAKAMADDRESCLAAGANDYIAKPLDVDKLLSLLRVWMPK
ncbi:MAG TPA: response regulator [Polyangiaceae bacterium]